MRQGELEGWLNAEYYRAEFRELMKELLAAFPSIQPLQNYAQVICGPFGSAILQADYVEEGVPLLRISDITTEGELDYSNVRYITPQKSAALAATQVVAGDLVISQRGTIGLPAVLTEQHPISNISANLIAIQKLQGLLPEYVQLFFSSRLGERQIARKQSGQVHAKITTDDIASVLIPAVSNQRELVEVMNAARTLRQQQLAEAGELQGSFNDFVMDKLGLAAPAPVDRPTFAISRRDIGNRLDAFYHSPQFKLITEKLDTIETVELGQLVKFSRETWRPETHEEDTFRYVEISSVNARSGEASWHETLTAEAPSRARMVVRPGDIIVSLTRPHQGSIALLADDFPISIASTGFAVLRDFSAMLLPDYLWAMLRTKIGLQQMMQRSSGGNYPAITEAELAKVRIPLPNLATQHLIAEEIQQRQMQARHLRQQAEEGWNQAKEAFEQTLLGNN